MADVCSCFNLKRDAYYKYKRRADKRLAFEQQVITLVKQRRQSLPREGVRKLLKALESDFKQQGLKVGRDALFNILRTHNMLTLRKKPTYKTTYSLHRFYKYKNCIKDLVITKPNQVWVSDITYIRTVKGFCYLALITDMYSRKIVGYDLSDSLELAGCVRALQKALKQPGKRSSLIHHSDRGIQYCSNVYTQLLIKKKIKISMTEDNHCYEPACRQAGKQLLSV